MTAQEVQEVWNGQMMTGCHLWPRVHQDKAGPHQRKAVSCVRMVTTVQVKLYVVVRQQWYSGLELLVDAVYGSSQGGASEKCHSYFVMQPQGCKMLKPCLFSGEEHG